MVDCIWLITVRMHDEKMLNFWSCIMMSLQIFHKRSSRTLTSLLLQSSVAPFPLESSNETPWNLLPVIPHPDVPPSSNLHSLTAVIPSSFSFLFCSRNLLVEWCRRLRAHSWSYNPRCVLLIVLHSQILCTRRASSCSVAIHQCSLMVIWLLPAKGSQVHSLDNFFFL